MTNSKVKDAVVEFLYAFLGFAVAAFLVFVTGLGEALSSGVLPDLGVLKSLGAALVSGLVAALGKAVLWYFTTQIAYPKPPA